MGGSQNINFQKLYDYFVKKINTQAFAVEIFSEKDYY